MADRAFASIADLSTQIETGALDPVDLTQIYLDRAQGVGRVLNAFVMRREAEALDEARQARARVRAGRRLGPLDGIPIALKDNIDVAGAPTGNGMGGAPRVATHDAAVTRRLRQAGAVLLGKLNMHEAALGGTTDNPHFGRTHNPYGLGYSPGGSSGGAGAAVAAGLCAAALGTDTAGSVRLPASYCGIVGLKPTFNRLNLAGIVPLCRKLDHVGPLTRTVADASLLMQALSEAPFTWSRERAEAPLSACTIAVLDNFANENVEAEVFASFDTALRLLSRRGVRIVRRRLPDFDPEQVRYAMFLLAEAGAAFEHAALLDTEPQRFSGDLARCVQYGRRMSALQLMAQENTIAPAAAQMLALLADVDAIASPTTPQAAFRFGDDGLTNLNTFCTLANYTGCPAISLPMGAGANGFPHGLQLIMSPSRDEALLALARTYEQAACHDLHPPAPFAPQT